MTYYYLVLKLIKIFFHLSELSILDRNSSFISKIQISKSQQQNFANGFNVPVCSLDDISCFQTPYELS